MQTLREDGQLRGAGGEGGEGGGGGGRRGRRQAGQGDIQQGKSASCHGNPHSRTGLATGISSGPRPPGAGPDHGAGPPVTPADRTIGSDGPITDDRPAGWGP
eukprot:767228-Hanusia_phi.AAC.1